MNTEENGKRKRDAHTLRRLLKYIDYLVAARAGELSAFRLNVCRQDALRCVLVEELARLARSYNSATVPEFVPFAMAMLKRKVSSGVKWQASAQRTHREGALGYASLDAPLDGAGDDPDITGHDVVADETGAVRGACGERLRRFYRVMAHLSTHERAILETLMDCEMNKTQAAAMLCMTVRMLRYRLRFIFVKFRSIWSVTD